MPTAFDPITGQDVDTASEAWRHSCECRWLLDNKPTRSLKHRWLYGVDDRAKLFRFNAKTGQQELRDDLASLWPKDDRGRTVKPIMSLRGIEAADRILADAKTIYDHQQRSA